MRLLLLLTFISSCTIILAQDTLSNSLPQIKLTPTLLDSSIQHIKIDSIKSVYGFVEKKNEKIDLLIEDYVANKKYNGYRIQIFSIANNRLEAVKAKSEFLKNFPDIQSYLVYQAPNYKVRVGDFLDRLGANQQLELIQESFPTAFLVRGEIEPKVK